MKCIVCDRCKTIIENPRRCRVITCARPLNPHTMCDKGKVPYRGNDPQQNDFLWEKEVCESCLDELESFFEADKSTDTPIDPEEPNEGDGDTEDGETDP